MERILLPRGENAKRLSVIEETCRELARLRVDRRETLVAIGGGALTDAAGLRRRGLPARRRHRPGPHHARGPDRRGPGRQDGRGPAGGQEPRRRLPSAGGLHRRRGLPGHAPAPPAARRPRRGRQDGRPGRRTAAGARSRRTVRRSRAAAAARSSRGRWPRWSSAAPGPRWRSSTADEREAGLRMILNLGHTIGHGIEAAGGYKALLHGEAVAYGLRGAFAIARAMDITPPERAERVNALLDRLGLAVEPPARVAGGRPRAHGHRQEALAGPPELGPAGRGRGRPCARTCRWRPSRPDSRQPFACLAAEVSRR